MNNLKKRKGTRKQYLLSRNEYWAFWHWNTRKHWKSWIFKSPKEYEPWINYRLITEDADPFAAIQICIRSRIKGPCSPNRHCAPSWISPEWTKSEHQIAISWSITIFRVIKLCIISPRFISVDIFKKSLREERKIGCQTGRPASPASMKSKSSPRFFQERKSLNQGGRGNRTENNPICGVGFLAKLGNFNHAW